jgi:hypothetical protein
MCVGFWSLDHPDYALSAITAWPRDMLANLIEGFCARIETSFCLELPPQRIFMTLVLSTIQMQPLNMGAFFLAEIS